MTIDTQRLRELARDDAREKAIVYKATNIYGETCYFGVKSTADAWAKSGKVDEVRLKELKVVAAPTSSEPPADVARDAELLDWLEQEAKASRTGVSIVYKNQADDESGIKRGYRLMRYHQIFSAHSNLRSAIDAAMREKGGA